MRSHHWWGLTAGGVAVLAILALVLRPPFPVDETRYLAVAWEMWDRSQFLVPHLNGEFYDHKPPALFWLIHLGWAIAGVNDWWPRLISPLATVVSLWALARVGVALWPDRPEIGRTGSLMFLGTWFIAWYQTMLMFDMPLLACVALSWLFLINAVRSGLARHWIGFGLTLGCALIVKGPVALAYVLPVLLACRWWAPVGASPVRGRWVSVAIIAATAVPAAWLSAAAVHGSREYFSTLLVDQTLSRVSGEFGHPRPWYWYPPVLMVVLVPWTLWWPAWKGASRAFRNLSDPGNRFLVVVFVTGLLVLSAVGGKQVHYMIPLLAALMLLIARGLLDTNVSGQTGHLVVPALIMSPLLLFGMQALSESTGLTLQPEGLTVPAWSALALGLVTLVLLLPRARDALATAHRLSLASLAFCVVVLVVVLTAIRPRYDLQPVARYVSEQQNAGRPIMYVGNYQGEFNFLGRLHSPVTERTPARAAEWALRNPDGLVVSRAKRLRLRGSPAPEHRQSYKGDELLVFRARDLTESGSAFRNPAKPDQD